MRIRTLPMNEWHSFFRDFSRIHSGAIVTLQFSSRGAAPRDEVVNQPFRGISEDGDEVFVHLGDGHGHPHLDRRMEHVDVIQLQQTDEGADASVDIASLDGTRTIVRFQSPALPELLDPNVE